jgi:hypothetical protein
VPSGRQTALRGTAIAMRCHLAGQQGTGSCVVATGQRLEGCITGRQRRIHWGTLNATCHAGGRFLPRRAGHGHAASSGNGPGPKPQRQYLEPRTRSLLTMPPIPSMIPYYTIDPRMSLSNGCVIIFVHKPPYDCLTRRQLQYCSKRDTPALSAHPQRVDSSST